MDIKRCTIDSQDILRHENARAFFVCLLSFVLSLLILGAALFGVYSLYTVSGLDKEKYSVPILSLLYALFSSEVTVSLFALSAVSYNRKRWFYRNASEKAPVSYLFAGEKFSVRLKVFYFFFFKKLMTALCLVDYTKPYLREQSSSALCCFCSDCTSARFFRKHFGCAKRYTSKTKNAP